MSIRQPTKPGQKPKPLPRWVTTAIKDMIAGRASSITAAAEKHGKSREVLSRHIHSDRGQELMVELARKHIHGETVPKAMTVFNDLLDRGTSERVKADIASQVLRGTGVLGSGGGSQHLGGVTFNFVFGGAAKGENRDESGAIVDVAAEIVDASKP